MPFGQNQPASSIPLQNAIKKLSKFFGLYTVKDLTGSIALAQVTGEENGPSGSFDLPSLPEHLSEAIRLLIDTSVGGYTSNDIVKGLNALMDDGNNTESGGDIVSSVNKMVKIICGEGSESGTNKAGPGILNGSNNHTADSIANILGHPTVNSMLDQPSRDTAPSLSVILMNNIRVLPLHKNVNAVTIFMNSLPTLEISRCVPYLDIQFQFGRPPVNSDDKIQTMGLIKFLDGAQTAANGTRRLLLDANMISGSQVNGSNDQFTMAGMEVFTAPQTLVNADEDSFQQQQGSSRRSAPVLDKFRPFMTFKSLSIDVAPTTGFMCFKTAKMEFTLHDKSRIAEIADFIRPDLYGTTEIYIEYGWSHPDPSTANNPYADLLNGMRCKEKYGIINTGMQFDEAGQVNVTLSLAMRGASDFKTETISSDSDGVSQILRSIRDLTSSIGELRRRLFQNSAPGTKEVRGVQIMDTAGDSNGQLLLTPDLKKELNNFRDALKKSGNGNRSVEILKNKLDELYGNGTPGNRGSIDRLRDTIRDNLRQKLEKISQGGIDPFLVPSSGQRTEMRNRGRNATYDPVSTRNYVDTDNELRALGILPTVPLGKLILLFVGLPLLETHKFDDIQILFYPFNQYAGKAAPLNIANFEVDTRYFLFTYTQYRMESAARAANVSLQDFLVFLNTTIIEDPAAPSYGLKGDGRGGNFWRTTVSQEGNVETETTLSDSLALQTKIEDILKDCTPNGEFKLPQLDYYIECLGRTKDAIKEGESHEGADALSIMRLHIFDKNTTSYDTQASLLEANREEELRFIRPLPQRTGGNEGVRTSQEEIANATIQAASNAGLIELNSEATPPYYRIKGGPGRLRDFMMKTSPFIIVGCQGTAVKTANLSTQQDAALSIVNLLRSFHADPIQPNGESPGGLPLQVIPCELSLNTFGCPLLEYGTKFFVDFGTGTTIDNYYYVTGLSHRIEPGGFMTDIKCSPYDGWGKYRSLIETIRTAQTVLEDIQSQSSQPNR